MRHEKLQVLYWLKTQTVDSVLSTAVRLDKHRTTIQRWLSSYRSGGIAELLSQKPRSGRLRLMNAQVVEKLEKELSEAEGFSSYKKVHQWLTNYCNVPVAYRTVHQWTRYRLQGKLKVPRSVSEKQKAGPVEEFKKTPSYHQSQSEAKREFLKVEKTSILESR